MPRLVLFLPASLCFLSRLAAAGDTAWQLHLDRHAAVGDRCSISTTGKQNRRVETSSPTEPREVSEERIEIIYTAIHEVRAVDGQGRPSEVLLHVDRLCTDDGSGPQEQFPAGTLITATADGDQTRYHLGREELEGSLSDALNLAGAKLPSAHEPSEEAVFLNPSPRFPGDRCPADAERLAAAIAATSPFVIDPATSTGEIRFDQPVTENGIAALATTTTFTVHPVSLRAASPFQRLTGSSVTSTTVRLFPIDPALPVLRETLQTTMKLIQRATSGPKPAGSETTFRREVTRFCLPLPGK